jgi:ParB-like chromosome segregation protein Spo0J
MKKTLLLTIFLALNPLNADTTNMSEQDLVNEFMKMQEQIKEAKYKTDKKRKELEDVKKLGRTVDKLAKKLGVDN